MTRLLSGLGTLVLLGVVAATGWWWGRRQAGENAAQIVALTQSIATLTQQRDSARARAQATSLAADTVWQMRWLPVRAQVESLPVDRPVPYPVYVNTVQAADTMIRACRVALSDCATRADLEAERADSLQALAEAYKFASKGPWADIRGEGYTDLGGRWFVAAEAKLGRRTGVQGFVEVAVRMDSLAFERRVGLSIPF